MTQRIDVHVVKGQEVGGHKVFYGDGDKYYFAPNNIFILLTHESVSEQLHLKVQK